jgi:hypothetical protein
MWATPRGAGVVPAQNQTKLALLWTLRRYCYPAIRCGGIVIGNPARNQAVITSHPLLCPDTMARCPRGAWGPRRPAAGDRGWIGIRGGGISGGALRGRRRGACPVCGV